MKEIRIKTIPPNEQRYATAGDYFHEPDTLEVRITQQKTEDSEFLVAIHELVEEYLTRHAGIKEQDILAYDLNWEKRHAKGLTKADEPGEENDCIYREQHAVALIIEYLISKELGVDFDKHNEELIYQ
jgi:hypothetical protein